MSLITLASTAKLYQWKDRKMKKGLAIYRVTIKKGGSLITNSYEFLVVATGIFNVPHIPELWG